MDAVPLSPIHSPASVSVIGLMLALFLPLPAQAGSVTAESIWSRNDARSRALQQVPTDAKVIRTRCRETQVGIGNFRYRCSLEYEAVPSEMPEGSTLPTGQPDGAP